jgi:regulation of enolase protein 1 (concanavalin A-like superfamily)
MIIMKKVWINLLIVLAVMSSCNNTPRESSKNTPEITKGEDCSVKVSGVEFTKSLNGAKTTATVDGDKLIIKSNAKCDNFNDPDGKLSNNTAPVLLTKIDNTKPFTFIAKVTPTFIGTYDAGTMYIYLNPKLWFKFAFERDERMKTRVVTVRTIGTSDDNNHDVVDNASVYMKISSDVKTIGFYYSLDKENWQLVRLFKNDYPVELWVGLSTQSPIGNGTNAIFEECSLTQSSIKDFRMGI